MNYYKEIKNELIDNELTKKAKDYSKNKSDLTHYYNVGKLIVEAQGGEERAKYGDSLIKEYSKKLTIDLGKGYNISTLKRMRQLYIKIEKGATVSHQLTRSHYVEILSLKSINEINYYLSVAIKQNLSYRELRNRIKLNEYQRLDDATKNKLINKEETGVSDLVKNPIVVHGNINQNIVEEKCLKKLILEDIGHFLRELGDGFTYIDNEYKIKIGDEYNYIDILLFNIKYNCYVVVELKVTKLSKNHIGQIQVYMNYINEHIKSVIHNNTIGIIICKEDNKLILKYCSDPRIFSTTYKLVEV